jgi:branched-chain amino acid transport system ATP-binding protein
LAVPRAELLQVRDIRVAYGGIEAVRGVSIEVAEGEIVTLIGANGAGKTTTLRTISGLQRPQSGEILFRGRRIDRLPAHEIVRGGIGHAPEGRRVFPRLSVRENLEMGAFARRDDRVAADFERVHTLFPVLAERADQAAGTLSGGEQQMLAIGRALMGGPALLMLDEPSLGLAPRYVQLIFDTLEQINEQGTTILLVEQNAQMALRLAARGYVIETGEIVLSDTGENLLGSDQVRKAYLGEE